MNELQVFNFENKEVRTVMVDNTPYWVLKDVCDVLDLTNPTVVAQRLDDDERTKLDLGRQGETTVINESGLYSVILRSDKPNAKIFRKWVTSEVLPSIRKHGAYMNEQTIEKALTNPDFLIQLATQLKEEQEKREQVEIENKELKPKALFADAVSASKTSILVGEMSKLLKQNGIEVGQNRLFEWLRNNGYLMKTGDQRNMPTQKSMELGLFEIKERTVSNPDGTIRITRTPKVTGKGQVFFVSKFREVA